MSPPVDRPRRGHSCGAGFVQPRRAIAPSGPGAVGLTAVAAALGSSETSSSDLPLVSGDMKKQTTNATAVSTAPNSIVVPVPNDDMLSGRR